MEVLDTGLVVQLMDEASREVFDWPSIVQHCPDLFTRQGVLANSKEGQEEKEAEHGTRI